MKSIDEFRIVPKGLRTPEGEYYLIRLTLDLDDGDQFVTHLGGPLEIENLEDEGELTGFAFGKTYYHENGTLVTIRYGENDSDPAEFEDMGHDRTRYYKTTTALAKDLMDALDKHTFNRAVAEVAVAPRRAQGPATQQGKTPRDPTFEKLPKDISQEIRSYLGGKTRRRKTKTSRRNRKTRAVRK